MFQAFGDPSDSYYAYEPFPPQNFLGIWERYLDLNFSCFLILFLLSERKTEAKNVVAYSPYDVIRVLNGVNGSNGFVSTIWRADFSFLFTLFFFSLTDTFTYGVKEGRFLEVDTHPNHPQQRPPPSSAPLTSHPAPNPHPVHRSGRNHLLPPLLHTTTTSSATVAAPLLQQP